MLCTLHPHKGCKNYLIHLPDMPLHLLPSIRHVHHCFYHDCSIGLSIASPSHVLQDDVTLSVQRSNTCYRPGDRISVTVAVKSDRLHIHASHVRAITSRSHCLPYRYPWTRKEKRPKYCLPSALSVRHRQLLLPFSYLPLSRLPHLDDLTHPMEVISLLLRMHNRKKYLDPHHFVSDRSIPPSHQVQETPRDNG